MTNKKRKEYARILERRKVRLSERLENWKGNNDSYTRAELAAVSWALTVIKNADAANILKELE